MEPPNPYLVELRIKLFLAYIELSNETGISRFELYSTWFVIQPPRSNFADFFLGLNLKGESTFIWLLSLLIFNFASYGLNYDGLIEQLLTAYYYFFMPKCAL